MLTARNKSFLGTCDEGTLEVLDNVSLILNRLCPATGLYPSSSHSMYLFIVVWVIDLSLHSRRTLSGLCCRYKSLLKGLYPPLAHSMAVLNLCYFYQVQDACI